MADKLVMKLINNFKKEYPRTTRMVEELRDNEKYPQKILIEMAINISIMDARIESGKYDGLSSKTILSKNNNMIDFINIIYMRNFRRVLDEFYNHFGNFNLFPKLIQADPTLIDTNRFVEKIIKQVQK